LASTRSIPCNDCEVFRQLLDLGLPRPGIYYEPMQQHQYRTISVSLVRYRKIISLYAKHNIFGCLTITIDNQKKQCRNFANHKTPWSDITLVRLISFINDLCVFSQMTANKIFFHEIINRDKISPFFLYQI